MDKYAEELFKNSNKVGDVQQSVIEKYQNKVSDNIIDLWKTYGFCSTEDGYFKIVNPNDYESIINDIYDGVEEPIVVFATGMADLILFDEAEYLSYVDIRHQRTDMIGRDFSLTMDRMATAAFRSKVLSWNPYEEAVKKYGIPKYEECFAYQPLLSLGGNESVDSMKRVNLQVHLDIVSQMQDIISI